MENITQNLDIPCVASEKLVTDSENSVITSEICEEKSYSDFLEAKILCFEKNIYADKISDVLTLANNYPTESLELSIEKVLSLYPFFKNDSKKSRKITTGVHFSQSSNSKTSISGVEAAFKISNHNIKI